jgi:hypothetical protein
MLEIGAHMLDRIFENALQYDEAASCIQNILDCYTYFIEQFPQPRLNSNDTFQKSAI